MSKAEQQVVEAAARVRETAEAVTATKDARNAAMRDAAASGHATAAIARAARMARPQVHNIIAAGLGTVDPGDVLAAVTETAEAARQARTARHAAVQARDAVLVEVTESGAMTAARAADLAGLRPSQVSETRARARAANES
ncbi:sRNA-binding protein [Micrococcus cohnii]|uniref:SRNA-binding protein n=1 Tax=Micrococcus cohnii TaxID=993416 RepID=A0A7W7GM95_9MICC|nr:hypothetical protein [Micrococcus cohnii]MBB4734720.1 sRNA-binding protein [Micrococcus cohnii]